MNAKKGFLVGILLGTFCFTVVTFANTEPPRGGRNELKDDDVARLKSVIQNMKCKWVKSATDQIQIDHPRYYYVHSPCGSGAEAKKVEALYVVTG